MDYSSSPPHDRFDRSLSIVDQEYAFEHSLSPVSLSFPTHRVLTTIPTESPSYISPYTRGDDLPRARSPSPAASRLGIHPDFVDPRTYRSMSRYSSSSRTSSVYSSPGPHQQRVASSMASSSRAASSSISAVSQFAFSFHFEHPLPSLRFLLASLRNINLPIPESGRPIEIWTLI